VIGVCGVVLAAGEGMRLRPLTASLPKALCPVGNVPLLDRALDRLAGLGLTGPAGVAVNAAYLADQIVDHVGDRAHVSVESDGPLGTAGGVGNLKDWIDGRGALTGNSDAYLADPRRDPGKDIAALLDGWSGETVRMLTLPVSPGDTGGFSGRRFAGFSLLPWRYVRDLPAEKGELVHEVWRPAEAAGELELIGYEGGYVDTGTPADYLRANLAAAHLRPTSAPAAGAPATRNAPAGEPATSSFATGGLVDPTAIVIGRAIDSVIGAHATVRGTITRCVVLPGAVVAEDETLTDAIRAGTDLTVLAPTPAPTA
jgi:NDP-sugar pyrophosphorylase family protein